MFATIRTWLRVFTKHQGFFHLLPAALVASFIVVAASIGLWQTYAPKSARTTQTNPPGSTGSLQIDNNPQPGTVNLTKPSNSASAKPVPTSGTPTPTSKKSNSSTAAPTPSKSDICGQAEDIFGPILNSNLANDWNIWSNSTTYFTTAEINYEYNQGAQQAYSAYVSSMQEPGCAPVQPSPTLKTPASPIPASTPPPTYQPLPTQPPPPPITTTPSSPSSGLGDACAQYAGSSAYAQCHQALGY